MRLSINRVAPLALMFLSAWLPCLFISEARAQWVHQQLVLQPGWNAVFLEVDPAPAECDSAFGGLPIESVWDWNGMTDLPQFVQDPSTLVPGAPGWLTWFPPTHPLASQATFFSLRDGRPYLIKLADNAPVTTWTLTGKPSLRRTRWPAGGVNFVGFHVGSPAPAFATLFAGEAGLAGQPVYRLTTAGAWEPIGNPGSTSPVPGAAYWVRCAAPAQRTGTIEVDAGSREGMVFKAGANEQSLRVRNTSSAARTIFVRLRASAAPPAGEPALAGPMPLEYRRTDFANTNFTWEPLPATLSFAGLAPGQEWNLRLSARFPATLPPPGAQYQGVLEVSDDAGMRWLIPLSALQSGGVGSGSVPSFDGASPHAGLWIGEAVINEVSQPARASDPASPRSAGGEFPFRLILHVDGSGVARLLQQVCLVRQPALLAPDPANPGDNRVERPARMLALTDESLIPVLVGPGEITGRRVSSAAFGSTAPVELTGAGFGTGTLSAAISLDYNHPLNPFRHRFHPDHNNLDERFEQTLPEGRESFTVTRTVSMEFTATDPLGLNPPGWGTSEMGGVYRETFGGLHRDPIHVRGHFRLVRVARMEALNQ